MEFPMKEYLEAIQTLDPIIVKFLTYNAVRLEKQWREDKFLFRDGNRYLNIRDYVMFSDRVKNLMFCGEIKKTDLLLAFRADMKISELNARRIIQQGIDEGKIKERATPRIKWISI